MAPKSRTFSATLERLSPRSLGWTIARVPFDPSETWTSMIRHRVAGEINGFPFRTSLFPQAGGGGGGYFLLVNRDMQRGADVALGQTAEIRLWPDLEPRPAELPDELAVLLDEEPGLRNWYDGFSESTRREIGKWINAVKSDEARVRRAEQTAERLLAAMEAARELPPALAAAFRDRPRAHAGWHRMTDVQRRNELLAVFHYQTPDARQRRIHKLCDTAEKRADAGEERTGTRARRAPPPQKQLSRARKAAR